MAASSADEDDAVSQYNFGVLEYKSREEHARYNLTFVAFLAQICLVAAVTFLVLWFALYDKHQVDCNGNFTEIIEENDDVCYGPTSAFTEFPAFEYHALLMPLGMVFVLGEGAISFRVFRGCSNKSVKFLHMFLMLLAILVVSPGIYSIFSVTEGGMGNIHDWIGITAIVIMVLQWLVGFVAKVFPGASPPVEHWYRPIHNFFGIVIFGLAVAVTIVGTTLAAPADASAAGILSKAFVFVVLAYGILVVYIVVNTDFKRRDAPDPEQLRLLGGQYFGRRRGYGAPISRGGGAKDAKSEGEGYPLPNSVPPQRKPSPTPSVGSRKSVSFADETDFPQETDLWKEEPITEAHDSPLLGAEPEEVKEPEPEKKKEKKKEKSPKEKKPFSERFTPKRQSGGSGRKKKSDPTLLDWVSG